jgi:hypothetical protein
MSKARNLLDKIPGGKADTKSPKDFDQKQLKVGIAVELEHVDDRSSAREIAMDHLAEDPDYYRKLYKHKIMDEPEAKALAKKYSK